MPSLLFTVENVFKYKSAGRAGSEVGGEHKMKYSQGFYAKTVEQSEGLSTRSRDGKRRGTGRS